MRPLHQARHQRRHISRLAMIAAIVTLVASIGGIGGASAQASQFDWNWEYPAPTCEAGVVVTYPKELPAGQSNDANIRVKNVSTGEVQTFNFHNNTGTWEGVKTFDVTTHPSWPGWLHFEYQWTQVGGTNYHWQGSVECRDTPTPPERPAIIENPLVDQRTTCESGVESRKGVEVIDWHLDGSTWVALDPVATWENWTKVRDLTPSEKQGLDCAKPAMPEAQTGEDVAEDQPVCVTGDGGTVAVVMTVWKQDPVFDESTWEWTFGQKVYEDPIVITTREATTEECAIITPTDPPSEKPTPVPSESSLVKPEPSSSVSSSPSPAKTSTPQLAKTGTTGWATALIVPLLVGGVAALISRRQRSH